MICLMDIAPKSHVRVHTILYNNFQLEGIVVSNYGTCIGVQPVHIVPVDVTVIPAAPQIFIIPAEYISLLEILGEESVDTYKVVLSTARGKFNHYLRK